MTTSKAFEYTPLDFDDICVLLEEINSLNVEYLTLKEQVDTEEATNIETVLTDPIYFDDKGKPMSMQRVLETWKVLGIDHTLPEKRERLASLKAGLDYKRSLLDMHKVYIELWRTMNANLRSAGELDS